MNERDAQEREPVASDAGIVIICHPRNVCDPAQTLTVRIQRVAGELSLYMSWSDVSGAPHQVAFVVERKDHA
jgi:hypothetical protein